MVLRTKGSGVGRWVRVVQPVQFLEGYNDVALLSLTVGLQVCYILIFFQARAGEFFLKGYLYLVWRVDKYV